MSHYIITNGMAPSSDNLSPWRRHVVYFANNTPETVSKNNDNLAVFINYYKVINTVLYEIIFVCIN